jgi:hypothetical protein
MERIKLPTLPPIPAGPIVPAVPDGPTTMPSVGLPTGAAAAEFGRDERVGSAFDPRAVPAPRRPLVIGASALPAAPKALLATEAPSEEIDLRANGERRSDPVSSIDEAISVAVRSAFTEHYGAAADDSTENDAPVLS